MGNNVERKVLKLKELIRELEVTKRLLMHMLMNIKRAQMADMFNSEYSFYFSRELG